MQELTLTGATLLSDPSIAGGGSTNGSSSTHSCSTHSTLHATHYHHATPGVDTASQHLIVTALAPAQLSGGKSCCGSHATVVSRPILAFRKPAVELVQEIASSYERYQLVLQVIRMGQYELFLELMGAWRNLSPLLNGGSKEDGMTIDRILHAYDTSGHTLTHWAAKRVDDVRIMQYLLNHVTYDPNIHYKWNPDQKDLLETIVLPTTSDTSHATTNHTVSYPTPVHRPALDDARMTPLHWACTQENCLSLIKILLDQGCVTADSSSTGAPNSLLEIRDGTGCTPCLIAAQHGRVETVAYLIQRGANVYAVDTARDSAIHWASYKGSEAVLGLVSFYSTHQQFYTSDAYGQTPIHLASLRGHTSVVRYILHQLLQPTLPTNAAGGHSKSPAAQRMATIRAVRELLSLKDQNGRTPYDLAVHKNKPAVAAVLKAQAISLQRMSNPSWQWQQYCSWESVREICQLRTWKVWLGFPEVDDLDESPRFPFYYVCAHLVCHFILTFTIFIPLFNITEGVLWDYMMMLSINLSLIFISAYTLYQCHTTNPGRLDASYNNIQLWRRLYEQTLDAFASSDESLAQKAAAVQLCHTCHIARPPRSKHDRFSRACILQFDHHCPFVGTTVGLYNYKWFFAFILAVSVYFINFLFLLIVYYRRTSADTNSYFILLLGLYMGLHILFSGGMVIYHSQLVLANLTTNEHLNMNRYDYLWRTINQDGTRPSHRTFHNPWNRGCCNNMYDRFVDPGDRSYLVPSADSRNVHSSSIELHQPLIGRAMETV
jgi:palmitoyltransferase ZDHHC13/17